MRRKNWFFSNPIQTVISIPLMRNLFGPVYVPSEGSADFEGQGSGTAQGRIHEHGSADFEGQGSGTASGIIVAAPTGVFFPEHYFAPGYFTSTFFT